MKHVRPHKPAGHRLQVSMPRPGAAWAGAAWTRRATAAAVLTVLAAAAPASAGSIWAKAQGQGGTRAVLLYQDDTARRVGDSLTIAINERSVIENETTRGGDKASKRSVTSSGTVALNDVSRWMSKHGSDFTLPTVSATSDASSDFDGKAKYESDRSIVDQVTVTVADVLPNGNLVVLGSCQRNVDGDTQVIHVSGIVRPSDISFANVVSSNRVADFHMVVKVKGPENHWTRPGWLGRILNWLSPW